MAALVRRAPTIRLGSPDVSGTMSTNPSIGAGTGGNSNGSIWKSLLESAGKTAEFQNCKLLFLGSKDAGKSSLIRALQTLGAGNRKLTPMEIYGENHGVSGLDFAYFNIRNLDDADLTESLAKCNLWMVQDAAHIPLLEEQLVPDDLKRLAITICLDLSRPWHIREDLNHWLTIAADLISKLQKQLKLEEQDALRERQRKYIESYRQRVKTADNKEKVDAEKKKKDTSDETFEPLMINLGVPIIVAVCKSDRVTALDTRQYPKRDDVLLAHLRHLCLPYGAALIYLCTKDAGSRKNVDTFYKYLTHRVYDFEFSGKTISDVPEAIFYPSGWDTAEEIKTFVAGTVAKSLETPPESLLPILENVESTPAKTAEVQLEDPVSFLKRIVHKNPSIVSKDERIDPMDPKVLSLSVTVAGTTASAQPSSHHSVDASSLRKSVKVEASPSRSSATTRKKDPDSLKGFFRLLLEKPGDGKSKDGGEREGVKSRESLSHHRSSSTNANKSTDQ